MPVYKQLNQQMVDELAVMNSPTELVCLAMKIEDSSWVKKVLLEQFYANQVKSEFLFHLIELYYKD